MEDLTATVKNEGTVPQGEEKQLSAPLSAAEIAFYSDPNNPSPHQQAGGITRGGAVYLLISALIGLVTSAWLWGEEIFHTAHPKSQLSCSINAAIDCGKSMDSVYGHLVFGLPNAVWGVFGFLAMAVLAVWLLSGKTLPRIVWWLWTAGTVVALAAIIFFLTVSIRVLGVLCPYCLVIWTVGIPLFGYISATVVKQGARVDHPLTGWKSLWVRYSWVFTLCFFLCVIVLIVMRFGHILFG